MGLTNYALEGMGFEQIPADLKIKAHFRSLNVYKVRGIVSDKQSPINPADLKSTDNGISFSLGDSVNEICRLLANDNFTDDEERWRAETNSNSPYLVVLTQSPEKTECDHGYWKQTDDEIVTHDCFTEAKETLQEFEKKRTSVVVASLSALLSQEQKPVVFVPIVRKVFAETNLKKRLRDLQFTVSGEAYVSRPLDKANISNQIDSAVRLSHLLHPKVGYFFGLASKETDRLKKFLYLYLVIEIHTHQTFKELDYSKALTNLHVLPDRIAKSAATFYVERQKEAKNLSQRFMWCSILRWKEVQDSDIESFKSLKRVRDCIYHGEEVAEKTLPISEAQMLAIKLMRCNSNV